MSEDLHSSPVVNPIKLGLLGLNFGEGIARRIVQSIDCIKLIAVCDLDQAKASRVATELGVKAYHDLDLLLADPDIEAIALFTGPAGRGRLISKILQTGRHVLTTKPFELDRAEAEKVLQEAHDKGLVVQLNSPGPKPAADIALIHQWIKQNDLGRPVAMHARTWADYREKANGSWYDDVEKCAAAPILRLGVYFLSEFASLMGEPESVRVQQSRLFTQRPTADQALLSITFANGAMGSVFASFCIGDGRPWRDEITLNFERGTITRWVERLPSKDMNFDHASLELWQKDKEVVRAETQPGEFAGWYQWNAFWEAIRGKVGTTLENKRDVLYGVRLVQAMQRAALSGDRVQVG